MATSVVLHLIAQDHKSLEQEDVQISANENATIIAKGEAIKKHIIRIKQGHMSSSYCCKEW